MHTGSCEACEQVCWGQRVPQSDVLRSCWGNKARSFFRTVKAMRSCGVVGCNSPGKGYKRHRTFFGGGLGEQLTELAFREPL